MKVITVIMFCLILGIMAAPRKVDASGQDDAKKTYAASLIHIGPHFVSMPIGRIVLVRRGSEYCAMKFTEAWEGKGVESPRFANYESYYQGDGTGDFSKSNVQFVKDTLVYRESIFGRLFPIPFGHRNFYINLNVA